MATTRTELPKGSDGEDASATVEMALLLPVYLLLFVGLVTVAHLSMIRQQVVQGTRLIAWLPVGDKPSASGIDAALFTPWHGYGQFSEETTQANDDVRFVDRDLVPQDDTSMDGVTQQAFDLAKRVMNDDADSSKSARTPESKDRHGPHLKKSYARCSFTYTAAWFPAFLPNVQQVRIASGSFVYYRREDVERNIYDDPADEKKFAISDRHPIEDFVKDGENGFIITKADNNENNRYLLPGGPDKDNPDEANLRIDSRTFAGSERKNPPGVWNRDFRIGGSVQQERAIFKELLRAR